MGALDLYDTPFAPQGDGVRWETVYMRRKGGGMVAAKIQRSDAGPGPSPCGRMNRRPRKPRKPRSSPNRSKRCSQSRRHTRAASGSAGASPAHRVPLSVEAVALLRDVRPLEDGSGLVFPSPQRSGGAAALSPVLRRARRLRQWASESAMNWFVVHVRQTGTDEVHPALVLIAIGCARRCSAD